MKVVMIRVGTVTMTASNFRKLKNRRSVRFVPHIEFTTLLKASRREKAMAIERIVPITPTDLPPTRIESKYPVIWELRSGSKLEEIPKSSLSFR